MQIPKQALLLRILSAKATPSADRRCTRRSCLELANCTWPAPPFCAAGWVSAHPVRLHTTKILRLSEDLPLVIEIVDSEDKINGFLPTLDEMMTSGLITLEKVQVLHYGAKTTA